MGGRPRKIPHDAELLRKMYWDDEMTLMQMARVFSCAWESVRRALEREGVTKRRHTVPTRCRVRGCGRPVHKVLHRTIGVKYGRRCLLHWKQYRRLVNKRYQSRLLEEALAGKPLYLSLIHI